MASTNYIHHAQNVHFGGYHQHRLNNPHNPRSEKRRQQQQYIPHTEAVDLSEFQGENTLQKVSPNVNPARIRGDVNKYNNDTATSTTHTTYWTCHECKAPMNKDHNPKHCTDCPHVKCSQCKEYTEVNNKSSTSMEKSQSQSQSRGGERSMYDYGRSFIGGNDVGGVNHYGARGRGRGEYVHGRHEKYQDECEHEYKGYC